MDKVEIAVWELIAARCAEEQFSNSKKRRGGQWNPYVHKVLRGAMRDYIIKKVKKPLMKAIITLANRYPSPTRENCLHPNTRILFDIRDKFFELENNPCRKELFEAIWRMFIAEYEHDGYYRFRFDWLHEEINKRDWRSSSKEQPQHCWKGEI